MRTKHQTTNTFALLFKRAAFTTCILFMSIVSFSQSETHNFITYDTVWKEPTGSAKWVIRISRPANMFTANNPDTASRPAIIFMPGMGEAVNDENQQKANAKKYGPHYWLQNGWDGSVVLSNGTHYPILITVVPSYVNPRGPAFTALITHILNTYRIKRNSVHGSGLSMGAFTWTKSIAYETSAGAETFMKLVTSITALQGASNETFAPYNAWSLGWQAFGKWASKYNGKFFGLEGTNDSRQVWQISENMNSNVPGSAYFSWETYGGGGHCCWNTMYNPGLNDWHNQAPITNPNIAVRTDHANTLGTYKKNSSIFQWMLRQGDSTLVGSGAPPPPNTPPTVDAGPSQTITLPANSVQLNGTASDPDGTIASYSWSKTSGPTSITFSSTTIRNPTVSNLTAGTYKLRLTVTDNRGASVFDSLNIIVNNQSVSTGTSIKVSLYGGSNAYNNSEWNNWNVGGGSASNITSAFLKYSNGSTSSSKATLNQTTGMGDNGASYPSGMAPSGVLRYTSFSTMGRTLTITGLSSTKRYTLEMYGGRASSAVNRTVFAVGSLKDTVNTTNNSSDKSVFVNLAPNAQGQIIVSISRLNTYTYLNGFTITEESGSSGRAAEMSDDESTGTQSVSTEPAEPVVTPIDIFPNPVRDGFVLKMNNEQTGSMNVTVIDMSGVTVKTFQVNKSQKSFQVYLPASGLTTGIYIVRVQIGNWTETTRISKL